VLGVLFPLTEPSALARMCPSGLNATEATASFSTEARPRRTTWAGSVTSGTCSPAAGAERVQPAAAAAGAADQGTEEFFAGPDLDLTLIRPARKDERQPRPFPNWLRQRVEAVISTLKNQLGLERHAGRIPAGL
jgi:hypothetical protein